MNNITKPTSALYRVLWRVHYKQCAHANRVCPRHATTQHGCEFNTGIERDFLKHYVIIYVQRITIDFVHKRFAFIGDLKNQQL